MRFSNFLDTWEGAQRENRLHRLANPLLALIVLILVLALAVKDRTVVLVPPNLEREGAISSEAATEAVKTSWALYLTTLIGNVTPKSASFLSEALAPNLSPRIYRTVIASVEDQAKQIALEQLTISFHPTLARYESAIDRVIVTGEIVTSGLRGEKQREQRTYEMGFVVQNYRVLLDDLEVYKGVYKTNAAESSP
jgi:conjugal transfer pilus assembly protein TraE